MRSLISNSPTEVEESSDNDEKKGQYTKFWNEFGKSIKLGIIEDATNRNRLAKLLRFETYGIYPYCTVEFCMLFSIKIVPFREKMNDSLWFLFYSTKSEGKLTSLDQYISRMRPGQKDIFYLTGTSKEELEKSPFLERLLKKNYEV